MDTGTDVFMQRVQNPIIQAAILLGGVILVTFAGKLVQMSGWLFVPERFPWMTAASFMLTFALFNSVFAVSTPNMQRYWGRSIYSFLGLAVAAAGVAWLASAIPLSEAGSYSWIFVVVSVGYMVFLGMMTTIRGIVQFAQKEEWNHPRIRNKKRK